MFTVTRCAVGLLTLSVADAHQDEAVHLLQTSFAKVVGQSDKECKRAKGALRAAKKKIKADRIAFKAARNAAKVAKQTLLESTQAGAEAQADVESSCPAPEVDNSPDQGCSDILVTSSIIPHHCDPLNKREQSIVVYGFDKVVPGGGVAAGQGTDMGSKLGIAVMQPCSVAWTVGNTFSGINAEQRNIPGLGMKTIWKKKDNVQNPCACREWAETVLKWPEAAAVHFRGSTNGAPGQCFVYYMTDIPWEKHGFQLTLMPDINTNYMCYLGNPEEWKQRVKAEKAAGKLIDKCSKTSLWSFGKLQDWRQGFSSVQKFHVGTLNYPDPSAGTEAGRKICLKWVKGNAKCAGAIAVQLDYQNQCYCWDTSAGMQIHAGDGRTVPTVETEMVPSNHLKYEVCML